METILSFIEEIKFYIADIGSTLVSSSLLFALLGLGLGILFALWAGRRQWFQRSTPLWTTLAKLYYVLIPLFFMALFGIFGTLWRLQTLTQRCIVRSAEPICSYAQEYLPHFQDFIKQVPVGKRPENNLIANLVAQEMATRDDPEAGSLAYTVVKQLNQVVVQQALPHLMRTSNSQDTLTALLQGQAQGERPQMQEFLLPMLQLSCKAIFFEAYLKMGRMLLFFFLILSAETFIYLFSQYFGTHRPLPQRTVMTYERERPKMVIRRASPTPPVATVPDAPSPPRATKAYSMERPKIVIRRVSPTIVPPEVPQPVPPLPPAAQTETDEVQDQALLETPPPAILQDEPTVEDSLQPPVAAQPLLPLETTPPAVLEDTSSLWQEPQELAVASPFFSSDLPLEPPPPAVLQEMSTPFEASAAEESAPPYYTSEPTVGRRQPDTSTAQKYTSTQPIAAFGNMANQASFIQSITLILAGGLLQGGGNIGSGWSAAILVIAGFLLFYVGLGQFKRGLDDIGYKAVGLLQVAAIVGALGE